jgi:hypothetical protein
VRRCGRGPIAGALLKVVRGPAWPELRTAAAIGGSELLDVRIRQLETGHAPDPGGLPRAAVAATIAGLVLLTTTFLTGVVAFGGFGEAARAGRTDLDWGAAEPFMAIACAVPWVVGGWLAWRFFIAPRLRPPRRVSTTNL